MSDCLSTFLIPFTKNKNYFCRTASPRWSGLLLLTVQLRPHLQRLMAGQIQTRREYVQGTTVQVAEVGIHSNHQIHPHTEAWPVHPLQNKLKSRNAIVSSGGGGVATAGVGLAQFNRTANLVGGHRQNPDSTYRPIYSKEPRSPSSSSFLEEGPLHSTESAINSSL